VEFEAALLTCDKENTDKVGENIRLGKESGVGILRPDISMSKVEFSVPYKNENQNATSGEILFGLGAIKGVGAAALNAIIEARKEDEFKDIFDFGMRVDLSKVNKAVIESLIKAGAFDSCTPEGVNRGQVFGVLERAIERGKSAQKDRETGQTNLFGAFTQASSSTDSDAGDMEEANYSLARQWTEREILSNEKASMGFFMSGHPMERYTKEAARLTGTTVQGLQKRKDRDEIRVAGIVMDYSERKTKSGKMLGLGALEDLDNRINLIVFSKQLDENSAALKSDDPVLIKGSMMVEDRDEGEERKIRVLEVTPLHEVRTKQTREVHLHVDAAAMTLDHIGDLKLLLSKFPGQCDTFFQITIPGLSTTTVNLPKQYRLSPSDDLLQSIIGFTGIKDVEFK